VEKLLDHDSFQELDTFVRHRTYDFDMQKKPALGTPWLPPWHDRRAHRVRVQPGLHRHRWLARRVMGEKMCKIMDLAAKIGCPVYRINDSGGARIQECVVSLGPTATCSCATCAGSGRDPQISLVMGLAPAARSTRPRSPTSSSWSRRPRTCSFTGPDVIKTVTARKSASRSSADDVAQQRSTGVAQFASEDEDA